MCAASCVLPLACCNSFLCASVFRNFHSRVHYHLVQINIAARPAADEPSTAVNNAVVEIDQVLQEPSTAASAVVEVDQNPQTAQPDGVDRANVTDKAADPQSFSVLNCVGMTNAILNQDKPNAVETQDS